jgi:hypothetical protein
VFYLGAICSKHKKSNLLRSACVYVIALFHLPNFQRRARILSYLRSKKSRNDFEEQAFKDLLSQIQFSKLGLSIMGYILLFVVTAAPVLFSEIPSVLEFLYGN